MSKNSKSYKVGEFYTLDPEALEPNPHQVRKHFDKESIAALAASIEEDGLLQNITFTEDNGQLYIVSGERRVRALRLLKEKGNEAPLLYGKYVEGPLRKLAFVENMFREDMTAVEFAEGVLALQTDTDKGEAFTQGALGNLLGLKRTTVNGIIAIAKMPKALKDKVRENPSVTRDSLERIARIKGEGRQTKAINDLLAELAMKAAPKPDDDSQEPTPGAADATRSWGEIAANAIANLSDDFSKKFTDKKYMSRFDAEGRALLVKELGNLKNKIEAILAVCT
jgi:ParB family chromosome partitioning protein